MIPALKLWKLAIRVYRYLSPHQRLIFSGRREITGRTGGGGGWPVWTHVLVRSHVRSVWHQDRSGALPSTDNFILTRTSGYDGLL